MGRQVAVSQGLDREQVDVCLTKTSLVRFTGRAETLRSGSQASDPPMF
jgi:hypothetical protein